MSNWPTTASKIAIIGSGAAGTSAAWFLNRMGYQNVTVFEKESRLGGKCYTLQEDNLGFDMGAVELTPDYRTVLRIASELGLKLHDIPISIVVDSANGNTVGLREFVVGSDDPAVLQAFAASTNIYAAALAQYSFLEQIGYQRVPQELTVPFQTWLETNKITNLERLFWLPITAFGYGDLSVIPAIYVLKFINRLNFATVLGQCNLMDCLPDNDHGIIEDEVKGWPRRLNDGFQNMIETMQTNLPEVVFQTGVDVTVTRNSGEVTVSWPGNSQQFDYLIVAVPPLAANLGFLTLTSEEQKLFSTVVANNYTTTLTNPAGYNYNLYAEFLDDGQPGTAGDNQPQQFVKLWDENVNLVYYTVSAEAPDVTTIQSNITTNISATKGQPANQTQSVPWTTYFPRFEAAQLNQNYYRDFYRIQSDNRTFYTGGVMSFELVENSMRYSNSLVNQYFRPYPWTAPTDIKQGSSTLSSDTGPALAHHQGLLNMAYKSKSSDTIYAATYNGSAWSSSTFTQGQPASNQTPAMTPMGGYLYMFFRGKSGDTNLYMCSNYLGQWGTIFNADTMLGPSGYQPPVLAPVGAYGPAATTFNNLLYIFYQDTSGKIAMTNYNTWSWGNSVSIKVDGRELTCDRSPAVTTYAGGLVLVYTVNGEINIAISSDARTWQGGLPIAAISSIDAKTSSTGWPSLAVSPEDLELYMTYPAPDNSGDIYQAIFSLPEGWYGDLPIKTLSNGASAPTTDANPSLAWFGGGNELVLAYKDKGNDNLMSAGLTPRDIRPS